MARAGIALGSNLGDSARTIAGAIARLEEIAVPGEPVLRASLHRTAPLNCPPGSPDFLNTVVEIAFDGGPRELLAQTQRIERELGRVPNPVRNAPRVIDLDILYLGDLVYQDDDLTLPHPRMMEREFVMKPLAEIRSAGFQSASSAPRFLHPGREIETHRHNLPHWQQGRVWVFASWRLADSLPQEKLARWSEERDVWKSVHPEPWDEATEIEYHERFSTRIDRWLDAGSGSCLLRKPANSSIVAGALEHFEGVRYHLDSFVVMPNHVHVLFSPKEGEQLSSIIHSWKRFTAQKINRLEGRSGALWQSGYWDRLIRSQEHFDWVRDSIRRNPEKLREGEFRLRE